MGFVPVDEIRSAKRNRKRRQAFYTPMSLVRAIVENCRTHRGCRALEPSAGDGRIIYELLEAGCNVDFCEIDSEMRRRCEQIGAVCIGEDFLTVETLPDYDLIVMNPPFTQNQDRAHLEHAWKFLRPTGGLHAITSARLLDAIKTRQVNLPGCNWLACERLPKDTFKESGAAVETLLVEATCEESECIGYTNVPTANAALIAQNTPVQMSRQQIVDAVIASGGSVYGIHWDEL